MVETCGEGLRYVTPSLDRNGKLHGVITFLAFERAHVEARLNRLNAGKPHWLAATRAGQNAKTAERFELLRAFDRTFFISHETIAGA